MTKSFPVIDLAATGQNILRLRKARGLTVRDLQNWFGFEEPQAIYKWQKGKSLPTVDNLYALGVLLGVSIEEILVLSRPQLNMVNSGQETSCPLSSQRPQTVKIQYGTTVCGFLPGCFEYGGTRKLRSHFWPSGKQTA